MKIGICRHFPVLHNRYKVVSARGFREWIYWYDYESRVKSIKVSEETTQWEVCIASDLQRAIVTAQTLFKGNIKLNEELREVPFAAFPWLIPIPIFAWKVLARIGWFFNMRHQVETRHHSLDRVSRVLSQIIGENSNKDILIVTHGFLMQYLQKEMLRLGFTGKIPLHPKGGVIYTFESK